MNSSQSHSGPRDEPFNTRIAFYIFVYIYIFVDTLLYKNISLCLEINLGLLTQHRVNEWLSWTSASSQRVRVRVAGYKPLQYYLNAIDKNLITVPDLGGFKKCHNTRQQGACLYLPSGQMYFLFVLAKNVTRLEICVKVKEFPRLSF